MSTPCYYCELDQDSCKFCIHEVDVQDLLQQARHQGWEQCHRQANNLLNEAACGLLTMEQFDKAIAAMEYKGEG